MVNHHPVPELLAAYSAGSLQLGYALCVSAHIEYCKECQTNVQRLKSLGGDLFNSLKPAPVSAELKNKVFARLDGEREDSPATAEQFFSSPVPRCLRRLVGNGYAALDWHSVAPSIKSATLCHDGDTQVSVLKLLPGAKVGHHSHMGEEITLVLEGSFSDEEGIYQQGDFILRDSGHRHKPIASKDGPCICLTIQDAPIQFTGFLGRLINPLLRRRYGL